MFFFKKNNIAKFSTSPIFKKISKDNLKKNKNKKITKTKKEEKEVNFWKKKENKSQKKNMWARALEFLIIVWESEYQSGIDKELARIIIRNSINTNRNPDRFFY